MAHGAWLVLLMALLAACRRDRAAAPVPFDLFFTSQVHGRITPCGCFSGQFGGITRLRTYLGAVALTNAIGVDAGDALEGTEDFHRMRHRQLAKAYSGLGFAAMNVGRMEAGLPAAVLRRLATESPVPLVSANVIDKATGRPLLPHSVLAERGGVRIAIVGVVDPKGFDDGPGEGLEIERMQTSLSRVLPELKAKADVIVLAAHTDEATLAALAKEFYEVSVVVGGRVSQPAQQLTREGRTLVYYTGNEGKSFGLLRLTAGKGGLSDLRGNDMVLLTDKIPEHPEVLALAAAYRKEVRGARLKIDDPARAQAGVVPGLRQSNGYAGSGSCRDCHAKAFQVWEGSAHAHAFRSLEERDSDADPSCLACHTVGFGKPGGYRREFGRTKLTDVGCESCHGPGSQHVQERRAGGPVSFKFRPLGAGDCTRCHQGEFSRPFDWDRLWPRVKH